MQNSPAPNRKRPTPGTTPIMQQPAPQQNYQYPQMPNDTDFTNFDFSNALSDQTFPDPANAFDANNFSYGVNTSQPQTYGNNLAPTPSTELVRRSRNQHVAPQNEQQQQQPEQWNSNNNYGMVPAPAVGQPDEENEQDLDRMVAAAKKDAQGKRKQIPPFVQKLSSFLDGTNTELIRWSDDGRAFIVLDEDEFQKTLIPELFKHSNYASFVRQLNMYGFHKTVNITDGSLRQSEKARKGVKPPSMYSHPYFRRNRPDLLWLIQKPGGKTTAKRKRDGTAKDQDDSDDERRYSPIPEHRPQALSGHGMTQDLAQLPRNELSAVRQELQKLQTQQRFISQMITQLKEQNDQFYRQASAFQALHDRHENSINAILTFLATFYNRSLEGHGAQNLVNMFTNAAQNQQHGSVVEEYNDGGTPNPNAQVQRFMKRTPLLLPSPASNNQNLQPGSAVTEPNSARASASPPNSSSGNRATSVQAKNTSFTTPPVKDEAETPNFLSQLPESNDEMMSLINNVNASTQASSTPNAAAPSALDFNSIVDQYQNMTGSPLTPQQRDRTLANIMRSQNGDSSYNNNALTSPAPPNFDLNTWHDNRQKIEQLQDLQRDTQDSLSALNRRLGPISPTGTVLGAQDPMDVVGGPGEYDPNAFINFGDDAGGDFDFGFDTSGNNGNGNFDGNTGSDPNWADGAFDAGGDDMFGASGEELSSHLAAPNQGGGRVESVSSEATSPAVTVQEEPGTPNRKRQRQS
ncbi:Heat shock transcription factor [Vermiconidia calcicola]|uniref:Heat shock transcription factor n=1 Tax=Vermiconidia calcicola TaxID=1690605 RepID=A0ACC3NFJ3_9PEZI|nr:Heat shock transcription factor [Vermiconidia calcicola]